MLLLVGVVLSVVCAIVILKLPIRALPAPIQRYAIHIKNTNQRLALAAVVVVMILALTGTIASLVWIFLFGLTCRFPSRLQLYAHVHTVALSETQVLLPMLPYAL